MATLKFISALACMLAVIPIVGLLHFGSVKHAWQYTKDWLAVMGWMLLLGLVLFGLAYMVIPPPN